MLRKTFPNLLIFSSFVGMATDISQHSLYSVQPLKIGVEVFGVDLTKNVSAEIISQIKSDVYKYRVMVFRKQKDLSPQKHVEISKWFGPLESTFYKHPKSPHPDIFRVSNDEGEGCTGVGRTGWHIDGSFQPAPFDISVYHIISVPKQGDTVFAPLKELLAALPAEQLARWERLWMVSDARVGRVHPLVYSHPVTGDKTMCFHLGMTEAFVWDYDLPEKRRATDWPETQSIVREIHKEFVKNNGAIQYSHKYEAGDFIISDNRAVGHEASPQTQLPRSQVGLRVMHRITVKGTKPPTKHYPLPSDRPQIPTPS